MRERLTKWVHASSWYSSGQSYIYNQFESVWMSAEVTGISHDSCSQRICNLRFIVYNLVSVPFNIKVFATVSLIKTVFVSAVLSLPLNVKGHDSTIDRSQRPVPFSYSCYVRQAMPLSQPHILTFDMKQSLKYQILSFLKKFNKKYSFVAL